MHDRLGMTDGAWPAEDEIDEVILLYKTSGSNMVRDFYVLPDFSIGLYGPIKDDLIGAFGQIWIEQWVFSDLVRYWIVH